MEEDPHPATAPWFTPDRRPALRDYWDVYVANLDAVTAETLRVAADHPELGPLVRAIPPEQREAQGREDRARQERAFDGEWAPYEAHLRLQGATYAKLGLSFSGWYDIARVLQRCLVPRLVQAYSAEPDRLADALTAMQEFIDRAMAILAQEYISTKERIITQQRELAELHTRDLARSEDALRRQTAILEAVLNTMRDGVAVYDTEGKLVLFNQTTERLMGVDPVNATATEASVEILCPDGVTPFPLETGPRSRAMRGEASDDVEMIVRNARFPEGAVLSVDGRPLDTVGLHGALVTFRDISEHKRLEAMRRRSAELEIENRRIQEANRLKSEFLANMSHELRTPLNAIIGFAELMYDGKVGPMAPQHAEFVGDILTSGQHLLRLINDVLDLAKVEAGRMEFRPEEVDSLQLVREVVGVLRSSAADRRLGVDIEVDPTLDWLAIDPARLKQVLYNYLSNAIKFTPEGGRVTVRAVPEGAEAFRLEVEDTGIGIAQEDVTRLFVEFQQLDAGAAKRHAGTGLGLALTRRLVEAQGGTVGVRSTFGRGSVFHAVLPRRVPGVSSLPPQRVVAASRPGAQTVLVVEDDARDQALLVQTLVNAGYAVDAVATGTQALARLRARSYDAITLDLLLPDVGGLDVLRTLRAEGQNRDTPVVVVTVVAERGAVAGFAVNDILPKPVDGAEVLRALERAGVAPRQGRPVLVVDDDQGSLRLMEATLAQLGYEAVCCADGASGLCAVDDARPAAIVLDLLMPEMDGFTFLDALRHRPAHRRTPVIVWTVKDLTGGEIARLRESAQAVLIKGGGGTAILLDELRAILPARRTLSGAE